MADVTDLAARRWDAIEDPAKHEPAEALRAALRAIESGELAPTHIIVLCGTDAADGGSTVQFFQSGSYRAHAQLGLIEDAKLDLWETGR